MLENTPCTMDEAVAVLTREQIRFEKKTGFQIKVGQFNFYPNKGTIYIDGQSALKEKGLAAFISLLRRARLAPATPPVRPVNDPAQFFIKPRDEDDDFATV